MLFVLCSVYELLEVMLFTSNLHADVESSVGELLDRFGSLAEVMSADPEALAAAGLSLPAIAGVKFVREAALRFLRADLYERPVVGSWDKLIDYRGPNRIYTKVEEFHILFLDLPAAQLKIRRQIRAASSTQATETSDKRIRPSFLVSRCNSSPGCARW
jgi:DNA repair protein RadC